MIIVTAGHVDHGKTSLLHALTGTHTAHLPEEKKRGLTIDLGYAYLPLGDEVLGFIDVPGHQKFLSNMLAGLGGIRHALLVISAEEGIKPQTVEHFDILRLLDFEHIMVVFTKADRVDDARIQALHAELESRFPLLRHAPRFVTSAQTGQGIDALKSHLAMLLTQSKADVHKPFRYAIDRVFTLKGAGVVVTGTAVSGQVNEGDTLFTSLGTTVRVKQIHAQNTPTTCGQAGERLALNISYTGKTPLTRGDWFTALSPDYVTDRITIKFSAIQPLKESNIVHVYHFASHTTGKCNVLDSQQGLAEIILDTPLHIAISDRLILRSGDDSQTLAGASVLEIRSPKRHKRTETRLNYLSHLTRSPTLTERLPCYLTDHIWEVAALCWAEQIFPDTLTKQIAHSPYQIHHQWLLSEQVKNKWFAKIIDKLTAFHQLHNDQLGVTKSRLHRMVAPELPSGLIYHLIDEMLADKRIAQTRGWIHTLDHRIELNPAELQIWAEIRPLFEATTQALWVRDIANTLGQDETAMRNLLYKIGKLGYLVPIVKDRFLLHEQILAFAELIKTFVQTHGNISVNQLRDEIGYGRKLTVQLIEYFDRSGFLRRKGDIHVLRDGDIF